MTFRIQLNLYAKFQECLQHDTRPVCVLLNDAVALYLNALVLEAIVLPTLSLSID
ncbi:hypothetical protein [Leptolyngbya sp. FACHB-16]|uniref:hypothetical protein n=2 Tax=unclassified Leptolyngbya TaxID=2650499 RepID=UPI001687F2D1|nr:hypothetical protein [Leptolyngbya sp. FACHB-16]MBD2156008.1 hypothetical protein [Leptolyngbya sp. FACHB-16]